MKKYFWSRLDVLVLFGINGPAWRVLVFQSRLKETKMDILVAGVGIEQKVELGCERTPSAACAGVSPAGREDAGITECSAGPGLRQQELEPSPDASVQGDGQDCENAVTPEPSAQNDVGVAAGGRTEFGDGGVADANDEEGDSGSSTDDSPANSSSVDEPVPDEEQTAPQLSKQAVESLLDELTAELVALEAFGREVDDRARENEWLGKHTKISLAVFRVELDRTGKYTFNVDENGVLLDDPVKFRLAQEAGAQITLRVHHGLSEAKKSNFILLAQGRDRERTEAENRELKRRIVLAALLQGLTYEATAELAGVHPNTARNVEKRAAADPNSKHEITQRPDGRFKPETRENIAKAAKLRKEGKSDAEIAEAFGTDVETVGKWFKNPTAQGKTQNKDKPGQKPKTSRGNSAAQSTDVTEDITAKEGIPKGHRLALESTRQDAQAYVEWLEAASAKASKAVDAAADSVEELLKLFLYGSQVAAAANLRLGQLLNTPGEVTDAETPPGDFCPDSGGCKPGDILQGSVMAIEPDEVIVALSDGSGGTGVIDNRGNCVTWKGPLVQGQIVRVRVEGFDSERGFTNLALLGRQTFSHAECASAFGPRLDNLRSPDTELAGLKAGPKEKEVI